MDKRDGHRRILFVGNGGEDWFGAEGGGVDDAGCDIAVQIVEWAGEDSQFLAEIQDVAGEREKSDQKDAKKQGLSFFEQIRGGHD